jgi:hypothetical protein
MNYRNDAVICCIALNEEKYIDEWTSYHLKLGFSKIYIYDNSQENVLAYLQSDKIHVTHFPGKLRQWESYNNFLQNYGMNHRWCAIIDCDEFIVLKKHSNILDFLQIHLQSGALGINWVLFGSNNHQVYTNEPVLKRFTRRQHDVNRHIKCIICCSDVLEYNHPHHPTVMLTGTNVKDVYGNNIYGPFNYHGDDKICQINHYFTKSKEEFERKRLRGNADCLHIRKPEEFEQHDFNDVEDFTAMHFLYGET